MHAVRRFARRAIMICLLALVAVFTWSPAGTMAQDEASLLVKQMVARIHGVSSSELRLAMAQDLSLVMLYLFKEDKLQGIDDPVIDRLAELLSDDSDALRHEVAFALGALGPRAVRAVPALEEALRMVEADRRKFPIVPAADSKQMIESSLVRITGQPRLSP